MKLQKQLQALHDDLGSDGIKKLLSKYETSAVTKTAVQMAAK
ncbi:hypothetical protein [Flexibacter flexilis]|nr:hypothetical protein [Flexibacter flexilis]